MGNSVLCILSLLPPIGASTRASSTPKREFTNPRPNTIMSGSRTDPSGRDGTRCENYNMRRCRIRGVQSIVIHAGLLAAFFEDTVSHSLAPEQFAYCLYNTSKSKQS
jgi:hypothetical protein